MTRGKLHGKVHVPQLNADILEAHNIKQLSQLESVLLKK